MNGSSVAPGSPVHTRALRIFAHSVQLLALAYSLRDLAHRQPQLPSFFSYYPLRPGLFLSASQTGRSHSCLCTCTSLLPGASAWHTQTSHQSGLSLHISLSERPPWEAREVKKLPFSVSLSFYFAELSSCCYLSSSEITFSKIYLFTGLLIVFPH